jgi:hypothetical protein
MTDFAGLLEAPVRVGQALAGPAGGDAAGPGTAGAAGTGPGMRELPGAGESPIAVLTAEVALLHARLDEIQSRLDGQT